MCIHVLKLINFFFFSKMLRLIFPGNMISFFGSVIISCVSNTIHRTMIYNIYMYFHSTRLDAIIHSITLQECEFSFFDRLLYICRNIKTVTNFYLNRHRNIESIS